MLSTAIKIWAKSPRSSEEIMMNSSIGGYITDKVIGNCKLDDINRKKKAKTILERGKD